MENNPSIDNAGVGVAHSTEDDVKFLNTPEVEAPDKPLAPTTEEPERAEEEVEKEQPEEQPEEQEEKPEGIYPRPTIKQIETEFPEFFKKFPDMRHAIAREQKYTELYPTMEDAEEAKENSESYEYLRDQVLEGKVSDFLEEIREVDGDSYKKFTGNFLATLYEKDKDTYFGLVDPIIGNVLRGVYSRSADQNAKNAALVISQILFGDQGIATGQRPISQPEVPKAESKDSDFENEKRAFQEERFRTIQSDIENSITSSLSDKLKEGLDENIDNDLAEILVERGLKEIDKALGADRTHQSQMTSLWKRGFKAGLSGDWKSRIKSAYLARAEHLIPAVRAKLNSTIIKTRSGVSTQLRDRSTENQQRREVPAAGSAARPGRNYGSKDIDYSKTSDMDILEDRPTLKRS